VRNVGNGSGTADLELRIDGSLRRSWSLSLAPGGSTTVSESTSFSPGSHTVEARVFWQGTQHDADRTSVNARSGTFFAVGPLDAPRRVSPNQSFTVSTTISNTGCSSGTQTIRFLVDGSQRDSTRVSLSAGGSTTVSFRWSFSSKGSYRVTIASDDDSSSTTIAVNGTPDPADDGQAGVLLPPIRGIQDTAALQQLIEAAKPGETLVLPSGIYQGTLVIRGKQGITLDGAGAVTLIGNGRDPVISIFSSQSVQIVGLTITRAYPAILVWKSEEVTIKGNTLMNNPGPGIDSQGSTIFISENTIRDNASWGIVIRSYPKASKAVITGNMLARNRSVGVIIFGGGSTEVEIRDNQIFETKLSSNGQWGRGIEIQSAKATIVNNLIQGHPDTGVIAFNSIIELVGNTITATRGFYGRGVELQKSEAMLIRNTITNNEDIGLAVFASKVRLQANVIHDNGYDLFADEQSTIEWEEGSGVEAGSRVEMKNSSQLPRFAEACMV
jgi:parallel beta-helix repeat protein